MKCITADEMDCDTYLITQDVLSNEIEDEEFLNFAIYSLEELLSSIKKEDFIYHGTRGIAGGSGLVCGIKSIYTPQLMKNVGVCIMNQF